MTRQTRLLLWTSIFILGPLPACNLLERQGDGTWSGDGKVVSTAGDHTPEHLAQSKIVSDQPKHLILAEERQSPPPQAHSDKNDTPPPVVVPAEIVTPAPAAPPLDPVVQAFVCLLKNQPAEALEQLQKFDAQTQEVIVRLLPLLAGLTHKGVDQMSPSEVASFQQQLEGVYQSLRCRAELVIDKACFCESIDGLGDYKPLPPDHHFLPPCGEQSGELLQLYVEMHNFHCEPRDGGFLTRLSSSVELRDDKGAIVWLHNFEDREKPLRSQTPRHDHFNNYSFYLPPAVRPGRYQLTIQVIDQTRPPYRPARKTVELVVSGGS